MDDKNVTMGSIISFLGEERVSASPGKSELCRAAITILSSLWNEGANTPEEALDILHDYQLQAKQYAAFQKKHLTAGKPFLKDGVWHCPDCNGRCRPNNSFCHRCGKKLGWR